MWSRLKKRRGPPPLAPPHKGEGKLAGLFAIVLAAAIAPAAAQIPPAVKFLIGGLNSQLPRKLDQHTTLTRLAIDGDAIDAQLVVEPGSPPALGIDVRQEAARLCGIDVFRTLTTAMKAQLRVTYIRPDQTKIGAFVIDRSICRS